MSFLYDWFLTTTESGFLPLTPYLLPHTSYTIVYNHYKLLIPRFLQSFAVVRMVNNA